MLIFVFTGIFIYERFHATLYVDETGTSFSIIGGADGPTAVFVAGKLPESSQNKTESINGEKMKLIIDDTEVNVLWEDNAAVTDLKEAVDEEAIIIEMSMYGGFEQVGSIGRNLTRSDKQTTTEAGDIVLYNGNQLVVFYDSNSWSYTRLGKIQNLSETELEELLSKGDVTIKIVK